ncbi:hypothetical protein [Algoriphagus namhaensis]
MPNASYLSFFWIGLLLAFSNSWSDRPDQLRIASALSTTENQKSLTADVPQLTGPSTLCIVFGSVIGEYFAGGDPSTDVYSWRVIGPSGNVLFTGSGGSSFQTLRYTFSLRGVHQIQLRVTNGPTLLFEETQSVRVLSGAQILLQSSYTTCSAQPLTISAIDPSSEGFSRYKFAWTDESGQVVSTTNELVNPPAGRYEVEFFYEDTDGSIACRRLLDTRVDSADAIQIQASSSTTCPGEPVTFTTDPVLTGDWYYLKEGTTEEVFMLNSSNFLLEPTFLLDGPANYEIIFRLANESNPACSLEGRYALAYNPNPEFIILEGQSSSGCKEPDGKIIIQALTNLDQVTLEGSAQVSGPLAPGQIYEFTGLKSGTYTGLATLGNCIYRLATVVELQNNPPSLEFEISDIVGESCTETGKESGSFLLRLTQGATEGGYRVINERGSIVRTETFSSNVEYPISISGGTYFVEVFDLDTCSLPQKEPVIVRGLDQVSFTVPPSLAICQEFDFTPQTTQDLEFTVTAPSGMEETKPAGEAFKLTEEGEYQIVGRLATAGDLCPTLKTFEVVLVDPIAFEPELVQQDCFGNRVYQAVLDEVDPEDAIFTWFNELDEVVSREEFLIPISNGLYKLDVQPRGSRACPIPPKEFLIEEPVLAVDLSIQSTQLCEFGPGAIIELSSTFPEEITDIEWRRYNQDSTITNLPEFKDRSQIQVEIAGIYEASVYSRIPSIKKDCELGRTTFALSVNPDKVQFSLPDSLSICENLAFSPETNQALTFQLTKPDGSIEEKSAGESFLLDQSGEYTFFGFDPNSTTLCPEIKTMEVLVNPAPIFTPVFESKDCQGNQTFLVELANYQPEQVTVQWRNQTGTLVGTDLDFTTSVAGSYSVEVQPLNSLLCESTIQFVEIEPLVLEMDIQLSIGTLCPDASFAVLTAEVEPGEGMIIQWWLTDLNGANRELTQARNQTSIEATEEGVYEVRLVNDIGCLLGSDEGLLLRSTDSTRPTLDQSYQVCPEYEIGPVLNPGIFSAYEWYLDDALVSTAPTYKPINPGNYTLIVQSEEGCSYAAEFLAEEECELRVAFPNAIQPANPDKQFLVYTNYLIDELEVSIYNQWGQLIYYCKQLDLIEEQATCFWDGRFEGKTIPNGSYAVRLNYKNYERNISEFKTGSILVIE